MSTEYGVVLNNNPVEVENHKYNLDLDLDLDIVEVINPGESYEGLNYNNLNDKPQINSVVLQDNISLPELGLRAIYYHTTNEWNTELNDLSENGAIYIYSDYKEIIVEERTVIVPGIKIGDGLTYIADLPFITSALTSMIEDVSKSHDINFDVNSSGELIITWAKEEI